MNNKRNLLNMLVYFIVSLATQTNFFDIWCGKQERMFYIFFLHKGSPRGWG